MFLRSIKNMDMSSQVKQKNAFLLTLAVSALFLLSLFLLNSGLNLDMGSKSSEPTPSVKPVKKVDYPVPGYKD